MRTLKLYGVEPVDELIWPDQINDVTLSSSALTVFTDFKQAKPLVIEETLTASDAILLMKKSHVRMKIVVNPQNQFVGVVGLSDLYERRIIQKIAEGFKRDELFVSEFMRPKEEVKAFAYDELAKAQVSDVVIALQHSGHQHCLVIDKDNHHIRGVISASDLARKLRLNVNVELGANFLDIFKVIHGA